MNCVKIWNITLSIRKLYIQWWWIMIDGSLSKRFEILCPDTARFLSSPVPSTSPMGPWDSCHSRLMNANQRVVKRNFRWPPSCQHCLKKKRSISINQRKSSSSKNTVQLMKTILTLSQLSHDSIAYTSDCAESNQYYAKYAYKQLYPGQKNSVYNSFRQPMNTSNI